MRNNLIFLIQYLLKYNFLFNIYLKKLKKLSNLSKIEIENIKLEKIKKIVKKANKSHFYKNLYKDYNTNIESMDDFYKLPIITKEMIKDKEELLLTKIKFLLFKGYTSGSSGSPLKVYYDYKSVIKENAYVWLYRNNCGLEFKEPVVSLRGNLKKNELFKYDKFTNTLYLSSYNLNSININEYYNLIKKFNPKAILAYPSSLYLLVILLKEHNLKLNVELIFTSSETLYESQKDIIESNLNSKIYDWYGNAERTISLQSEKDIYKEPILYSHNEFNDTYVISTNLNNSSFPLIRYKTNDIIKIENNEIKHILGRDDDFVILKDNSKIGRLDHIFKGLNGIKFAQIIQNKINEIDINIVEYNFTKKDEKLLKEKIIERLGLTIKYQINFIEENEIIYMPSGKFKMVINNVK